MHLQCTVCNQHVHLPSSRKLEDDNKTFEVNVLHALAEQTAGLAPAKVEKFFTTLGVDYRLHRTNHGRNQKLVGKEVTAMAIESCEKALVNEATHTKANGDIVNNVVQLSTTGDCAWPNRGSGRSYSSFCGMFVLVGALTKKILSTSIFDKMCYTCERAEKCPVGDDGQVVVPPPHDCWRGARGINCESNPTWRGASKAMEAAGAVLCVKSIGGYIFPEDSDIPAARVAKFTADEDSNMIAAINDPVGDVPRELQPVEKLSDPNHLQKLLYKALEEMRKKKGWSGATLSKTVIDYFNKVYRYVIKSVAVIEDLPGFENDDEKAEWIHGALLNIVDHAFNIDPTHAACRRYRAPRPDGSFYPWCGVESAKPDWKIHLPHDRFLVRDQPAGHYEAVREVFEKFAHKETILKQLHDTDTNVNESINGMVVKGYLPGGRAQQNGQSGVYGWACCHTIVSKNEGHRYRQELCRRLGIDPPLTMQPLDDEMDGRRQRMAAFRKSYKGKRGRLQVRLGKSDRNAPVGKVEGTYAGGSDLANDKFGNKI
ncbi:hypothetical protein CYMTET_21937 [Cymbomonas tetramitiformis]|uniref:Mutator-like transposase domain-containing protein n=1 Tax=Cymbomonas tetramitiformis TaxID=36881 RepID=A0AAE0G0V5_9CHLO|nr:hypothetical protein CYMTET_21937 [Cymbomonas tetramitiformis]